MKDRREQIMMFLAIWGVTAPLFIIAALVIRDKPVDPLVAGFIGMIVGSYVTVFGYYFGSSSGSKAKQDTIDKITSTVSIETVDEKKARWTASGSLLTFEEWIKMPENAIKPEVKP